MILRLFCDSIHNNTFVHTLCQINGTWTYLCITFLSIYEAIETLVHKYANMWSC